MLKSAPGFGAAMTLALLATASSASAQTPDAPAPTAAAPPRPITATPTGPAAPALPATPPPTAGTASAPAAAPAAPKATATAWKAPTGTKALPKLPEPPPPPDTPARLWLVAPGPQEPWTMRIDNEGARPIRIPADVRLLTFEVEVQSADPKKKKPTVYKCSAPASIKPSGFPERRALLLAPEQSYIETFDPRLFCFGKNADALVGTALVKARFGWEPAPVNKWATKKQKGPSGPFAVESADNPAPTAPVKQLSAPSIVLSFGTQGATPAAPPSTIAGADVNVPGAPAPGAYRPPPPVKAAPPPPPPPPQHNSLAPLRSGGHGRDVAISRKRLAAQQKELAAQAAAAKANGGMVGTVTPTTGGTTSSPAAGTTAATGATNSAAAGTTGAAVGTTATGTPPNPTANVSAPVGPAAATGAPANPTSGTAGAPATGATTPTPEAPPAPPKPVDQNAPRLAVEMSSFSDASAPMNATITVTIKNAGARSMVAALKPRMISFEVTGPDRTVSCPSWPPTHAIPRESYREYKPDAKTSFTLLLDEVCPDTVFSRPGLYSVKAGVWANENGDEIGVEGFTGRARSTSPTLLRLQSAKDNFYLAPPKAVPTPKLVPEDEAQPAATPPSPGDGSTPAAGTTPGTDATPAAPSESAPATGAPSDPAAPAASKPAG